MAKPSSRVVVEEKGLYLRFRRLAAHGQTSSLITGPTGRYGHGVIGDAIEASGLGVMDDRGVLLDLQLPADSVFEDRYPRFADPDGDGIDEILLVRSYLDLGAALAVIKDPPRRT